jgi:hypothetical protein
MAGSIEITKNAPSSEDGSNYKTQRSSSTTGMVEDLPIESMELEEKSEATYITGIQLYAVLVGVTLVAFLIMLDQTIMTTAIPQISSEFDSIKDIGWYGSAFLLST